MFLSVPNLQISRDETLDNKPIIFVRKRVKTHERQCRIPKFSGEDHRTSAPRGGKREGGRVEENRGGRGGSLERKGWKGRAKGKGRDGKRTKRRRGRGEERNLDPDVPLRSTPLIEFTIPRRKKCVSSPLERHAHMALPFVMRFPLNQIYHLPPKRQK
jgi:hypothetical protein